MKDTYKDLYESIMNKIRPIIESEINRGVDIEEALNFIKGGSWNYDCSDGQFDIYDYDLNYGFTLNLYNMTKQMLSVLCDKDTDIDNAYRLLISGVWNFECLEGKLDIYDERFSFTIDLYKLTTDMLRKLL